jgi:hypothetical protein
VLGVLDLATGERRSVLREFDDLQVLGPSRTRDRFYCTAEADDEYWLLGLQGMCSLQDTVELPDQPTAVCFDPGSGRVYLAFERGTMNEVVFWQEGDDTLSAGVTIPEHVVAMQRAGARLLCFGDGKLAMLDIGLWGAIPSTVSCGCIEARCGVLCDRTGTEVYYANQDTLVALDLTWPDSTRRIPVPDIDTLIRFPGARHILCVGREEITVIDIGLDSVVQTVHVEFDPWSSAVDTIGRRVYFGEGDRTIRMLEYDYEPLLGPGPVPTIVSGSVFLAGDADCQVYDINGRRVVGLTPGENDLSRLPAGVYFARSVEGGTRSAVRKVVIQK